MGNIYIMTCDFCLVGESGRDYPYYEDNESDTEFRKYKLTEAECFESISDCIKWISLHYTLFTRGDYYVVRLTHEPNVFVKEFSFKVDFGNVLLTK